MSIRVITAAQVRELLPMAECVESMESAMLASSAGTVTIPPRLITPLIDNSGFFALMPGSSSELGSYGAKIISLHESNAELGLPTIVGISGGLMQKLRTGDRVRMDAGKGEVRILR